MSDDFDGLDDRGWSDVGGAFDAIHAERSAQLLARIRSGPEQAVHEKLDFIMDGVRQIDGAVQRMKAQIQAAYDEAASWGSDAQVFKYAIFMALGDEFPWRGPNTAHLPREE